MGQIGKQESTSRSGVAVTYRIFRLPGVTEDVFRAALVDEILPTVAVPGLNRAMNVTGQRLRKVVGGDGPDAWLWTVEWFGPGNVRTAEEGTAGMLASVRERIERIGLIVSAETARDEFGWTLE